MDFLTSEAFKLEKGCQFSQFIQGFVELSQKTRLLSGYMCAFQALGVLTWSCVMFAEGFCTQVWARGLVVDQLTTLYSVIHLQCTFYKALLICEGP
jgi:hypothetical protein